MGTTEVLWLDVSMAIMSGPSGDAGNHAECLH